MSETTTTGPDSPFGAETNLIKKTITVRLGTGEEFEFRIPTIADEIRLGSCMRTLRRMLAPDDDLQSNLDVDSQAYLRSAAWFRVLLVADNTNWTRVTQDGHKVVDPLQFPPEKVDVVLLAAAMANAHVNRFRGGGTAPNRPAGDETVAGGEVLQPPTI